MRTWIAGPVVMLLGAALAVPTPALAAYGVVVQLPSDPIYSPFGGPVTVSFTFDPGDPAAVYTIRLRRPGSGTIREKDVLVDPATDSSPHQVSFSWPERTAGSPTGYVVDVRPQSGAVVTSESFTLLPPLVSIESAVPSPFYPLIQDGYKDQSRIDFALSADTTDTTMRVYAADVYDRCCGTLIRTEDLGPLPVGDHTWVWDGTRDDTSPAPKGTYFVKVEATDTGAVSDTSKAQRVELTTGTIRLTATATKNGSAYARVTDLQQTAIGGSCLVSRDKVAHTAGILCANANISVSWRWQLASGERIEKVSFTIDGGYYGCHKRVDHRKNVSILRVLSPPTSTCTVQVAKIVYSYPVQA